MRNLFVFTFLALVISGVLAFSGVLEGGPVYYAVAQVTPVQFAAYLFWLFIVLAIASVVLGGLRRPEPRPRGTSSGLISDGPLCALFFALIAAVSALFGFGLVASASGGLAMVVFWIAIILAGFSYLAGTMGPKGRPR